MAIINRELNISEKRRVLTESIQPVATGATFPGILFPYNCTVDAISLASIGLSGAPVLSFYVGRFIVGTGFTTFGLGITISAIEYGTSGAQSASLPAPGSTILNMLPNDILVVRSSGANSAIATVELAVIARTTDDIVSQFGLGGT